MTWPSKIYVATTSLGVYYTSDFSDPGTQPTWTAINTGLGATDCQEFWLDPSNQAHRQYVLLTASATLYRRTGGGNWASILTLAQISTLTGQTADVFGGFCLDASIPGRVWALARCYTTATHQQHGRAIYSDDYGDTWQNTTSIYYSAFGHLRSLGSIRAQGDTIFAGLNTGSGTSNSVYYSTNGGSGWAQVNLETPGGAYPFGFNALLPDRVYARDDVLGNIDLRRVTSAGGNTLLQDGLGPLRWDSLWFDSATAQHQRALRNGTLYATTDEWTNVSNGGAISPAPFSFAPWAGTDTDQILVGITIGSGANPVQAHIIGALYGEADTTASGIAGANARYTPFGGSIPYTCGGLARMGIQAPYEPAHIYTGIVYFEVAAGANLVHTGSIALESAAPSNNVHTGIITLEE